MSYTNELLERVIARSPGEPEFQQAVREVLETLEPVFVKRLPFSLGPRYCGKFLHSGLPAAGCAAVVAGD